MRRRQTLPLLVLLSPLMLAPAHAQGEPHGASGNGDPIVTQGEDVTTPVARRIPGGAHVSLRGPAGDRSIIVETPEGEVAGTHIRTTFNPRTGITSIWVRRPDGTRTGVHVDPQGNKVVSNHRT